MFENLMKAENPTLLLSEVKKISGGNNKLEKALKSLYRSKDNKNRLTATLFNYVYSSQQTVFLLSYRIFKNMLKKDPNNKRKTLNGKEYSRLIRYLITSKSVEILLKSSKNRGKYNYASLFKMIQTDIQKYVKMDKVDENIIIWTARLSRNEEAEVIKTECLQYFDETDEQKKILNFMFNNSLISEKEKTILEKKIC